MPARAIAAVAVALLSAMTLVAAAPQDTTPPEVHLTRIGETRRVELGPGASAHLNTDSALSVTNLADLCDIVLARGEALLEIRRNDRVRVRVRAGNVVVHPDAATFAVRLLDPDHVEVLVSAGSVVLASASSGPRRVFRDTRLDANQSARASPAGLAIEPLEEAGVARRLAWTEGILWFDGQTLEQAAREINRYNVRQLIVADPRIRELHIGGRFRCTDLERFVEALDGLGVRSLERGPAGAPGKTIRLVRAP